MTSRTFCTRGLTRYVLFTGHALAHMYAHVQRERRQPEAGGELFSAQIECDGLIVSVATGPYPGDRRRRHAFDPDVAATTRQRYVQFEGGRHAVGLWHTHPETSPHPSGLDERTTFEYLRAFGGDRCQYLMVILGNRGEPPSMTVWSADGHGWHQWKELR
jgi:proteasome lid subunit RPN8/RPN11